MNSSVDRNIPMLDLSSEIEELWEELSGAALRVLRSGSFVLGHEVEAFEREAASYLGVKHAVGLNSGTDALVIGLRALGVGPGDEVVTTSFSFFATAEAIVNVGATPVFIDVDAQSFNLNPELLEAAVTPRTKAVLPVHLFGNPAAMSEILEVAQRHGLKVLEDCAQSFGADYYGDLEVAHGRSGRKTGTLGDAGAFSFYPTKNLGAYGDGGMLVTNDDEVARLARMLRNHGASPERRYENEMPGYNSRLDEIQAAVLRVKLPHVDRWNRARREIADHYRAGFAGNHDIVTPVDNRSHIYHQFTVRLREGRRDALKQALAQAGIASAVFYPVPLHLGTGAVHAICPLSEQLTGEVLSLPIWPGMSEERESETVEVVVEAVREALSSRP